MHQARRQYNRLWNHYVAKRLGVQGQPPPQLNWVPYNGTNEVLGESSPVGQRPVELTNAVRKMLRDPTTRYLGQRIAAHEMRHVYQDLSHYDPSIPHDQRPEEIDANNFAAGVMTRVKKDHRRVVKRQARLRR